MTESIFASDFKAQPFWWEAAAPFESQAELPGDIDVVVVGSGFCGLSAGTTCLDLGRSVLVMDAGPIGGMASSRSGAMISSGQKILLKGSARGLGKDKTDAAISLHADAFAFVKGLAVEEGLDFDFQQCGRMFLASVPSDSVRFEEHANILRNGAHVKVHVLRKDELRAEIGSDFYYGGMLVEEFGGLHPSKLGRALARRFASRGGLLASHTRVHRVSKTGEYFLVETDKGALKARHVLFATNGYTDRTLTYLKRRVAPAGSHIIATEPLPEAIMAEIMPRRRMYSDSKRSLWYFRPSPEGDRILFGAGSGAFPMPMEKSCALLYRYMCRVFPQLDGIKISHGWAGNVAMTSNGMQQIGSIDGVFYATGCNGSGVAIMPYLGKLAAERMLGERVTPTLFETARFGLFPPYNRFPWFVSLAAAGYQLLDWTDRIRAGI